MQCCLECVRNGREARLSERREETAQGGRSHWALERDRTPLENSENMADIILFIKCQSTVRRRDCKGLKVEQKNLLRKCYPVSHL